MADEKDKDPRNVAHGARVPAHVVEASEAAEAEGETENTDESNTD